MLLLQDDGFAIFIPPGSAKVLQLADMNPSGSPLTEVVVHLRRRHLLLAVLEDLLRTVVEMDILEPFLCPDAALDDFTHPVQGEQG